MNERIELQRALPHRKFRKTLIRFSLLTLLFIVLFAAASAQAEGSKDLVKNGGYRPYIEWYIARTYYSGQTLQTALKRRQIINVYAKAGETLYFGSSVDNALTRNWIWHDSTYPSPKTIKDIRITTPSGAILDYDVINDPSTSNYSGYIPNHTTERMGASRWATGGYDALTYTVPSNGTGVYTFEFYSPSGNGDSDPTAYEIGNEKMSGSYCWGNNGSVVDAWDITVADGNGNALTGRVFAPYLTISMGTRPASQSNILQSVVYVLTEDGYLYETDFNGINPNGFLFLGNSRGLLDLANDRSLYHSSIYTDNSAVYLRGQTGYHLPNQPDTEKDKTYRIFFNKPNADLLQYLGLQTPMPPADISNFSFNGGRATRPGAGGDFHFTTTRSCSYELEIRFGTNNVIYIADVCQAGDNVAHWNGLDYNGDIVQAGQWTATLRTKGGEYHFPIADAETCHRGLQIKLISNPPNPDPGFDPTIVYYDNSTKIIGGETLDFDKGRNAFYGSLTQLQGISSQKDGNNLSQALRYQANADVPTGYGDLKFFDTWTHFTSSAYTQNLTFVVANDSPTPPTSSPAPPTSSPAPPTNIPAPRTGDSGHPVLWVLMLMASALIVFLSLTVRNSAYKGGARRP